MLNLDDICNRFKHEHPLVEYIFYSEDVEEYKVEFLMETKNGRYLRYNIPDTLDPSKEEVDKALITLYLGLI